MKVNKLLKTLRTQFKNMNFFTYFKAPNVLAIAMDGATLPLVFITKEKSFPGVMVNYSETLQDNEIIGIISETLSFHCPFIVNESFYHSQSGKLYWGDNAKMYNLLENTIDLNTVVPLTDAIH